MKGRRVCELGAGLNSHAKRWDVKQTNRLRLTHREWQLSGSTAIYDCVMCASFARVLVIYPYSERRATCRGPTCRRNGTEHSQQVLSVKSTSYERLRDSSGSPKVLRSLAWELRTPPLPNTCFSTFDLGTSKAANYKQWGRTAFSGLVR